MNGTEFYIGSGFSDIYSDYTEVIRLSSPISLAIELDGRIGIELDGAINMEINLSGRTYT